MLQLIGCVVTIRCSHFNNILVYFLTKCLLTWTTTHLEIYINRVQFKIYGLLGILNLTCINQLYCILFILIITFCWIVVHCLHVIAHHSHPRFAPNPLSLTCYFLIALNEELILHIFFINF